MENEKQKKDDCVEKKTNEAREKIKEGVHELSELAKKAKNNYDNADEKTKKKVLTAVAGAVGLLAGVLGEKMMKRKKK